jgi:hypothetical protein
MAIRVERSTTIQIENTGPRRYGEISVVTGRLVNFYEEKDGASLEFGNVG